MTAFFEVISEYSPVLAVPTLVGSPSVCLPGFAMDGLKAWWPTFLGETANSEALGPPKYAAKRFGFRPKVLKPVNHVLPVLKRGLHISQDKKAREKSYEESHRFGAQHDPANADPRAFSDEGSSSPIMKPRAVGA